MKFFIAIGIGVIFTLLNCFAIAHEFFFIPIASVAAVIIYLLFCRADLLIFFMAFITPLSINIIDAKFNVGLSIPAEIIMALFTILFFIRLLYDVRLERKIVLHPISIIIYIYLIWMLITSITSELPLVSFKYLASQIWFVTACYFIVIQLIRNDVKKAITFFNCYALGLVIVILITTIKFALQGFSKHNMHWIMSPFYNDHTAYGAAIAFFIPLIIALFIIDGKTIWKKMYYTIILIIMSMGFYLSYCRAAWLSIIVAFSVLIAIRLRIKLSWLVVGFALLFSMLYYFSDDILYNMSKNEQDSSATFIEHITSMSNITTDASNVERLNRWTAAFGMIQDRPIVGWGSGTYQFVYAGYQKSKYKTIISTSFGDGGNAHSEFIGPCAEMGIPGAIIVLLLMIIILYTGIKTYIRSSNKILKTLSLFAVISLISYYVHGIMNNFLDTDKLSLPFWSAVAVIVVVDILSKEEKLNYEQH